MPVRALTPFARGLMAARLFSTRRAAPRVLATTPVKDWNAPAMFVPDPDATKGSDCGGENESFPTCTTVAIDGAQQQLQRRAGSLPINWYTDAGTERVQPTPSGWIDTSRAPFDDAQWSTEEDTLLARVLYATPEGLSRQWQRIAATFFPHRSSRDLRLRWETRLKPQQAVRDPRIKEAKALRKLHGDALTMVGGRWAVVPSGRPTLQPYEEKLDITSQPVVDALHEQHSNRLPREDNLSEGIVIVDDTNGQKTYQKLVRTHTVVGLLSYDYALQAVHEAERARTYKLSGELALKTERSVRKQSGEVLLDEVEWLAEEDMALREGFELFGSDWQRLARGLKPRRRTAEECRERMEQLCQQALSHVLDDSAVTHAGLNDTEPELLRALA